MSYWTTQTAKKLKKICIILEVQNILGNKMLVKFVELVQVKTALLNGDNNTCFYSFSRVSFEFQNVIMSIFLLVFFQ